MNNKLVTNIISSIGFSVIGLILGWLFFSGSSSSPSANKKNMSKTHNHGAGNHSEDGGGGNEEIWTCSMHPQIRQTEAGDCPICGMDLIPLDESGEDSPIRFVMTKEAVKLAQIETMIIGTGKIDSDKSQKEILLTGKVKMNEQNSGSQNAHIRGRIEELYVNYTGEKISKGQQIAKIYSPELVAAQKELIEAIKLKSEMPSLYEAAKAKIRQWKLPNSILEEIEKSGKVQQEVMIYADRSGVVMKKYIEEGDYVKAGQPMFDIMDLSSIWVLFDIYEKDLNWVREGQIIEFNLAAMPEKTFKASISFIDPIINPITRVASARVELYNPNGRIKPDMFAKGILKASPLKKGKDSNIKLSVPKTAVMWTGKRSVVYIKIPNTTVPTYEFREVELGADLGENYLVASGLENGDEVVVHGTFRLDAAAQLNNKASMMNRMIEVKGVAEKVPDFKLKTADQFKLQLTNFVESYIQLKDQLVATDFEGAKKALIALEAKFNAIDMSILKEEDAHLYWMKLEKGFKSHFIDINKAKNIDLQREQFSYISELLAKAIQAFGISEGIYYLQHCPMALDDKGANWLSKEEKILNPYFGDKMLSCGVVKDNFK